MNMKRIIPIMAFAALPITSTAQGQLKSGIDLANLDQTAKPETISTGSHVADG